MSEKRKIASSPYNEAVNAVIAYRKKARAKTEKSASPGASPIPTEKVAHLPPAELVEKNEEHFEKNAPPDTRLLHLREEMDTRFLKMPEVRLLPHERGTQEGVLHDLKARTWDLAMIMSAGDALDRLRRTSPIDPNECFIDELGNVVHPLMPVLEKLKGCGMRMNDQNYWTVICCKIYVRHLQGMGLRADLPMYPNGWRNVTVKQYIAQRIAPLWECIRRSNQPLGGLHYHLALWLAKEFDIELK